MADFDDTHRPQAAPVSPDPTPRFGLDGRNENQQPASGGNRYVEQALEDQRPLREKSLEEREVDMQLKREEIEKIRRHRKARHRYRGGIDGGRYSDSRRSGETGISNPSGYGVGASVGVNASSGGGTGMTLEERTTPGTGPGSLSDRLKSSSAERLRGESAERQERMRDTVSAMAADVQRQKAPRGLLGSLYDKYTDEGKPHGPSDADLRVAQDRARIRDENEKPPVVASMEMPSAASLTPASPSAMAATSTTAPGGSPVASLPTAPAVPTAAPSASPALAGPSQKQIDTMKADLYAANLNANANALVTKPLEVAGKAVGATARATGRLLTGQTDWQKRGLVAGARTRPTSRPQTVRQIAIKNDKQNRLLAAR